MDGTQKLMAIRTTIQRLEHGLEATVDEAHRNELARALALARAAECLAEEEFRFERGRADPKEDARRWRLRADEYLSLSEVFSSDIIGPRYRALSVGFRRLADRAELSLGRCVEESSNGERRPEDEPAEGRPCP